MGQALLNRQMEQVQPRQAPQQRLQRLLHLMESSVLKRKAKMALNTVCLQSLKLLSQSIIWQRSPKITVQLWYVENSKIE